MGKIGKLNWRPGRLASVLCCLSLSLWACGGEEAETQPLPQTTQEEVASPTAFSVEINLQASPTPSPSLAATASPSPSPTDTPTPAPPTATYTPSQTFTVTPAAGLIISTPSATPPPPQEGQSGIIIVDSAVSQVSSPTLPPALTTPTAPVPASNERLSLGQTRASSLTQAGEIHRYSFFATANETVSLLANLDPQAPGTLDPYLEIQAPNGEIIAQNDDMALYTPDALIRDFIAPVTGVYIVYLRSNDQTGTGAYLLTLNNTPFTVRDVQRGPAQHSLGNEQTLETFAAREVWTVDLVAGEVISVAAAARDPLQGLDVMLELAAPDGTSLGFNNDIGDSRDAYLDSIAIPSTGEYKIYIAARNNASTGDYTLWWQRLDEIPTGVPPSPTLTPTFAPPSAQFSAEVAAGGNFTYALYLEAGESLNVVVLGVAGFDPLLRLYDPEAKIILELDDSNGSQNPRATLVAESPGFYTIEVSGFEGAGGSFSLNYIVR